MWIDMNKNCAIRIDKLEDIYDINLDEYAEGTIFYCFENVADFCGFKRDNEVIFYMFTVRNICYFI